MLRLKINIYSIPLYFDMIYFSSMIFFVVTHQLIEVKESHIFVHHDLQDTDDELLGDNI
jgi:hypothetical protein